jgi:unsaturated rhamnogalacturonyl hydrolase
MAVVDVLDDLPPTHPDAEAINEIFHRIADGIVRWQDPQSGVWWQIVDQPGRTGNYLEASASSMLVYALAKGVNRGYLPREKFLPAIERGYAGLVREFVRTEPDGSVNLTRICEVAGLNYTSASGRARDGSFDYYVSEPVVENDLKGVGPFILAGIEVEPALSGAAPKRSAVARGWSDVPAILARIKSPDFPARDFSIADFGAVPGGDATGAIKAAIATCHAAGGGRVVVPAGEWRTGAIHLKSRVNLHVAKGATLRFSTEPSDYLPVVMTRWEGIECMNYSPLIYAFEQEDVAVTGEGTLDGGASDANWWAWKAGRQKPGRELLNQMGERGTPVAERVLGEGKFLRPNFIQFYRCRGGLVEGVTIVRSPMWEIHPVLSTNVTVRGVKIDSHGPNNDGCDPESCRDVLIEDCTFDTGDDCIAIKSGRNNDGRRVATPSENIIVRRCVMKDGHGGVVLGSEISGDVRNVFVEDCAMDSPNLDRALRFKSNAVRGGVVEGVFMRNVKIGRVSEAVLTVDFLYEEGSTGSFKPIVRQVQLDHIVSESSPRLLFLRGFDGATIDDLRINDSVINGVTEPDVVQFVGTVTLRNVTLNPAKKTGGSPSALPVAH